MEKCLENELMLQIIQQAIHCHCPCGVWLREAVTKAPTFACLCGSGEAETLFRTCLPAQAGRQANKIVHASG